MRLYSLLGTTRVAHPRYGEHEADADGAFELPEPFALVLHATHYAGVRGWETAAERAARLGAEEAARQRDPATLLAAVQESNELARAAMRTATPPVPARASAPRPGRRASVAS